MLKITFVFRDTTIIINGRESKTPHCSLIERFLINNHLS